jgi:GNAT superfamily N-acetyltransferase
MDDIEIHALTPERLDDYLYFMEHDAFGGNPDWEGCYCLEGHAQEEDERPAEELRAEITELIRGGRHHGLLAYRGDRMVGWCHASPLVHLANDEYRQGRPDEELAHIGAIVCFNLAEEVRRAGLPAVLLREALRRFADAGLTLAEAYPWKDPAPRPQRNYLGTVNLYEIHGFERAAETDDAVRMQRAISPETVAPRADR